MVTTPKAVNCAVLDFCREVAPDSQPLYLQTRPFRGAVPQACFDNVDRVIRLSGGEPQYGWLIWEWPGAFMEAEHHCVLRCNDGRLRDVTPQDESRVLFLPDDSATCEPNSFGRPNIRRPLSPDPLVAEYIALFERRDSIVRTNMTPGLNQVPPQVLAELMRVEPETLRLTAELWRRTTMTRGFVSKCA